MAWTTPKTWTVGEVVTAANMNTHVRDNLTFLANPARVKTKRSATQNISHNVITILTWDQEYYDTQNMHSTTSLTNRLTVPSGWDGNWHLELDLEFAANATGFRGIHIVHSTSGGSATIIAKNYLPNTGVAVAAILHCSTDYAAVAGDYFYAEAWQTSGGTLATGFAAWDSLSARWVSL